MAQVAKDVKTESKPESQALPEGPQSNVAVAPEGPESAEKPDNSKDVGQLIAQAHDHWLRDGMELAKVFVEGDKTRRQMTMKYADIYSTNEEAIEDFLKGFKEEMGGGASAIQTASKIKAVFLAWNVKAFEDVVGTDEKTKEPIKQTKSGKEWLMEFKGTFEGWSGLARRIRGPVTGKGAGGGPKEAKKLRDDQADKIVETIKTATAPQSERLVKVATDQMIQAGGGKGFEPKVTAMIYDLIARLVDSPDLAYQKLAEDLRHVLNDFENERAIIAANLKNAPAAKQPEAVLA